MSVATIEQLDLFTADARPSVVLARTLPGIGRVLDTRRGGWRARWTGDRWGWCFYRSIGKWGWESWEPTLPFGVEHVLDRDTAERILTDLVDAYGDDPRWLERRRRRA